MLRPPARFERDSEEHAARRPGISGKPSVSVVIPVYNGAAFLERTVASVYAQTVVPSEVIVVNDGSTDETEDVLRRMASGLPASFHWYSKEHGGEASARNFALRLARGTHVAFLDHDDFWHPDKLARQLDHFAADLDLDLSFTAYTVNLEDYRPQPGRNLRPQTVHHEDWDPNPDLVLDQLVDGHCPIGTLSTVLIRREAVMAITPFDEQLPVGSDYEMYLKFAVHRMKMDYLSTPLVQYRWHGSNISRDTGILWECLSRIFDRFFEQHREQLPGALRGRERWWRSHWHLLTAIDAIQHGDKHGARRHIIEAARRRPLSVRPGWVRMLGIGPAPPLSDAQLVYPADEDDR